jgi:ectoine hydroxylase-related dioxygenase (phytanoyl-CoA dioxygenase family)
MNSIVKTVEYTTQPAGSIEEAKGLLDTQGFCVLSGLISDDQVEKLHKRLSDQAIAEKQLGIGGADQAQLDESNQYIYALVNKGKEFVDLVLEPTVLELVGHVLGKDFLLSATDGIIAHPGGSLMPLHSDQWWMPDSHAVGKSHFPVGSITRFGSTQQQEAPPIAVAPPAVCNVMWMISPFTEENGGTRLVPGTHNTGIKPDPSIPHKVETIAAQGRAGTAVVFDGRLWHATGANKTNDPRYGIITAFCGPQYRPMENYVLGARDEILENASKTLLDLLGFKVWNGYGKQDEPSSMYIKRGVKSTGILVPQE